MSTVTPLVVRMGTLTVRAVLSTIFAALAVAAILVGSLAAPAQLSARASAARRLLSQHRSRIRPRHV